MKTIVNKDSIDRFGLEEEIIEVDTDGELWEFKAVDVITDTYTNGRWNNKRVEVEGFEFEKQKLWGTVEGQRGSLSSDDPVGLALLERSGHRFKVRDKVRFVETNQKKYLRLMKGEVIAIDPRFSNESLSYLVFFPNLDSCGISTERMLHCSNELWFPKNYKTLEVYKKALWCREIGENRIELLE